MDAMDDTEVLEFIKGATVAELIGALWHIGISVRFDVEAETGKGIIKVYKPAAYEPGGQVLMGWAQIAIEDFATQAPEVRGKVIDSALTGFVCGLFLRSGGDPASQQIEIDVDAAPEELADAVVG